jgi:hypothetical protein
VRIVLGAALLLYGPAACIYDADERCGPELTFVPGEFGFETCVCPERSAINELGNVASPAEPMSVVPAARVFVQLVSRVWRMAPANPSLSNWAVSAIQRPPRAPTPSTAIVRKARRIAGLLYCTGV